MAVAVAVPLSLKIFAAIHVAPGAMPIDVPPASPPTMTPIVAVPWPLRSVGVVGCWPYGSNQEFEPPRQRAARSGWPTSTPESRLATTTPWPVYPRAHRAGALTSAMFGSVGADDAGAVAAMRRGSRAPAGTIGISSGVTLATSARAAIAAITAGVAVIDRPLKTQNGVTRATWPSARWTRRTATRGDCDAAAWSRSAWMRVVSRAARSAPWIDREVGLRPHGDDDGPHPGRRGCAGRGRSRREGGGAAVALARMRSFPRPRRARSKPGERPPGPGRRSAASEISSQLWASMGAEADPVDHDRDAGAALDRPRPSSGRGGSRSRRRGASVLWAIGLRVAEDGAGGLDEQLRHGRRVVEDVARLVLVDDGEAKVDQTARRRSPRRG